MSKPILWLGLAFGLMLPPAWAEVADFDRVRRLVDNDFPEAYRQSRALHDALPAAAPAADRVQALNLMARAELYLAMTKEAGEHARAARDLARREGDRAAQVEADLVLALNCVNAADIPGLTQSTREAMELVHGLDRPDLLAEAMLRQSMLHRRLGDIDASVTLAMQTLDIVRRGNDPRALAFAYQGMAFSYDLSGRPKEALEHYRLMLEAARRAGSAWLEASAMLGIGAMQAPFGRLTEGERWLRQAIEHYRRMGGPFFIAHALHMLADNLVRQGRRTEAAGHYDEFVAIYAARDNKIGLWWALNARADNLLALGRRVAAHADAERAHALAQTIGLNLYREGSARRLAALYAGEGDYRRAYVYSAEAAEMADKDKGDTAARRILELGRLYQEQSRQREVAALQRKNQEQAAALAQRELKVRWLLTLLVGGAITLGITAYFLLRLRRSRDEIRALNAGLERRVQAATEEIGRQAAQLRTLVDHLPDVVARFDGEARFIFANPKFETALGIPLADALGRTPSESGLPEAGLFEAKVREVVRTGRVERFEHRVPTADGGAFWGVVTVAPELDEAGLARFVQVVVHDISDRKAAEATREAELTEAVRLATLRSEFLAHMSHELRTPLNGILGYTQLLQRDSTLNERQHEGVAVIHESGEHLLRLINDILDYARIEAGGLTLTPVEVALPRFLAVIAEIVAVKARQKGIEFDVELADDLPGVVLADETRLRQVLLNLLANAVKFTDRGRVRFVAAGAASGRLRFEVVDTGMGIADGDRETIFQSFVQRGDLLRRQGGTGLGLPISRKLARLMGGDITVESRLGEGSAFHLELALETRQAEAAPIPVEAAAYRGGRRRIMVVDGDRDSRAGLVGVLAGLGFDIVEAAGGGECLERLPDTRPDLVLMNVAWSDMDGFEAIRRLRRPPYPLEMPVVALSSGANELPSLGAGADAFLEQPVDSVRLRETLSRQLGIEWLAAPEPEPAMTPPPPDELTVLHRLAKLGNMRDLIRQAEHIAGIDPLYCPFAERLRQLAEGYQSKAILALVEAHMCQGV